MDTKLKKSKLILRGLSFFVGLSILLGISSLFFIPDLDYSNRIQKSIELAFDPDYQNSDYFREDLCHDLSVLLNAMQEYYITPARAEDNLQKINEINNEPQLQELASSKKYYYQGFVNDTEVVCNNNLNLAYLADYGLLSRDRSTNGSLVSSLANPDYSSAYQYLIDGVGYPSLPVDNCNFSIVLENQIFVINKDGKKLSTDFLGFYSSQKVMDQLSIQANRVYSFSGAPSFSLYLSVLEYPPANDYAYSQFLQARDSSIRLVAVIGSLLFLSLFLLFFALVVFRKRGKIFRFLSVFSQKIPKKLVCIFFLCALLFFVCVGIIYEAPPAVLVVSILFLFWSLFLLAARCLHEARQRLKQIRQYKKEKGLKHKKPLKQRLIARMWWFVLTEVILLTALLYLSYLWGMLHAIVLPTIPDSVTILFLILLFLFLIVLIAFCDYWLRNARELELLLDQIHKIKDGDYQSRLTLPNSSAYSESAEALNAVQQGISRSVDEQVQAERMKVDLVANVSHDLKTPLTSIISYVDLLQKEEQLPSHVQDYIQILASKSNRLKMMVQDVFELSKVTSGNLQLNPELLDLSRLLQQTLADMEDEISASSLIFRLLLPEKPVTVYADGNRLYRVYQNLIKNALQYSLEGSRVYIEIYIDEDTAAVSVKNTSKTELSGIQEDILERFVRGDSSRTTEGSGLGLSIAKTFTEACSGTFHLSINADLFSVVTMFPAILPAPDPFLNAQ